MEYEVRTLIVDKQVMCASQMCDDKCPNYDKCINAKLVVEEE